MSLQKTAMACLLGMGAFVALTLAQPVPAPTTPDKLCSVDTSATLQADTVVASPDSNGFVSIFDGKTFKGWWQNCLSTHSGGDRSNGAIWRVDTVRHAIYAMSRNGVGGLLSTHKRYAHYELLFEWWPQYGNDGGVFNRYSITSSTNVAANQMVLDYLGASGILSYYSEAGYPGGRNGRPWSYTSENAGQIPGSGGGAGTGGTAYINDWTNSTKSPNLITGYGPTDVGCAANGCVFADYLRLWNNDGWMQCRQIYYGGLSQNQPTTVTAPGDKIHEFTFFRKHYPLNDTNLSTFMPSPRALGVAPAANDTGKWIPVVQDSMILSSANVATYQRKNPFAFQVHTGSRYIYASAGGLGSWYRDIKVRELDSLGKPLAFTTVSINPNLNRQVNYDMQVVSGYLVGSMTVDHYITISDVQGKVLQEYTGFAGRNLSRELPKYPGVMLVRITSMRGTQTLRVNPEAK